MPSPTRASKLILLTDYTTESQFFVSCNKIIKVVPQGMGDTLITYIGQSEKVLTKRISTDASLIVDASKINDKYIIQLFTLLEGVVIYLNLDRVIYAQDVVLPSSYNLVTYDSALTAPTVYKITSDSASDLAALSYSMFPVTLQPSPSQPSAVRYINNLNIALVTEESVNTLPTFSFETIAKVGLNPIINNGTSGIVSATVAFSGGGATVQATGHLTIATGAIDTFVIDTPGSGYTSYPTITITVTSGTALTTPEVAGYFKVNNLAIVDAGENINTAPTLTFSAGGITAEASCIIDANTQKVDSVSLDTVGRYQSDDDAYPSLAVTGGAGAQILYDEKKVEFTHLQIEETVADIVAAVNAL